MGKPSGGGVYRDVLGCKACRHFGCYRGCPCHTECEDYLLVMKKDVFIYPFSDMEKVETKVRGKSGKTLFFTDRQGTQHEILSCGKGDKEKEEFERACRILNERV